MLIVAATVPDAPGTPQLLEATKTSIKIGWQVNYNGGISIDDYEVDWKIDTNDLFAPIYSSNNQNQFTLTGLQTGRLYEFKVRAKNEVGSSVTSDTSQFMAATVPAQPDAPLKVTADRTQITVKWVAPSDDGGTPLTGYILQWNEGGEGNDYSDLFTCN